MSSLRNILQRCARNASILGGTPLQIQCASTFNPVYSDPTYISRQTYSSDENEANKNANDPLQKYILHMMNAKKSPPNIIYAKKSRSKIAADQKASKSFRADSAQKTPFVQTDPTKSSPNVAKDQKAPNAPIFNKKNLNLRKYYIRVDGLSKETTPESLREFYSQFGEITFYGIVFKGEPGQFGSVAFSSRIAMDLALNSLPHCIDGKVIKNVRPGILARKQLTLNVLDLSPKTTTQSLKAFYSRFGRLKDWRIKKAKEATTAEFGQVGEVTFANEEDMHRALDAQPHVIDDSEVFLQYATFDLDFLVQEISEAITEEDLIAFYSKYGHLRRCRLFRGQNGNLQAFVSYSAIDEINRAMDDRPHIIGGKPLKIRSLASGNLFSVSLVVGSLPESVTEETLRKEFSKYGKPIFWKLENDGNFNQSGPYGIVAYGRDEEALNALNSGPHTIQGAVVDVRKAIKSDTGNSNKKSRTEKSVVTDENVVRLRIREVPESVTEEDLIAFYSKYGLVEECRLLKRKTGKSHANVSYSAVDGVNRAIDDRPHIIGGKPLSVAFIDRSINVTLVVGSLPESITEETLRKEFSKYGKPVYWDLKNDGKFNQSGPYGIVAYGSEEEALNALNSGPHTIEGAVVDVRKAKEARKSSSKEKSKN
ncbi:RNA recognition motif domain-containing protein [Ditylenchus destructor]|nr:RNA recognition motif domain-containing protein [Ditylenchus destructor]